MIRIYIAGPMTGYPEHNYPAFHEAAARVRERGHTAFSPAEINAGFEHEGWVACMRRDLPALAQADAIVMLPGSYRSRGARLELEIAKALELQVFWSIEDLPRADA